ncbi:diiron oxygenase [Pseudonocardiaceae bacterium YIM PH 21723]|nr:diiron oxygenase [Pseudonocardiaceae bacterium YIM PH 21723]
MSMLDVNERDKTAGRLLKSSAKNSYDPELDIDWDAPLVDGLWGLQEHRSSLYGTEIWQRMPVEQRQQLTIQESASVATAGIWFEMILMRALLKRSYHGNPQDPHIQYALTEVADECRHSIMFARYSQKVGLADYRPHKLVHFGAQLMNALDTGAAWIYAAILVAEEILDRLQREMMVDPAVQPLLRQVNRIHVLEEARHVTYAREEVQRYMAKAGKADVYYNRLWSSVVSYFVVESLISPRVYGAVGLNTRECVAAAKANPHWHATKRYAGEKIVEFLNDQGLIGHPGKALLKRAHLI